MPHRFRVLADAREVVRPVLVCQVGITVVACAMALQGWHAASLGLGCVLVVLAGTMVLQVRWAVRSLHRQSHDARQSCSEAEQHYVSVLRRIVHYAEARDRYWRGHSQNVADLAERIARRLGLPDEQCRLLHVAGQLHDIGVLAVPESVLLGHSRFGVREFRTVQRHSEASYEIIRPLESMGPILGAVRHHHERMNGTGYPSGLSGEQIPLGARILAVADAYDAMTHDRPHRAAMTAAQAMAELHRCTPSGYDPGCVAALAEVVNLTGMAPPEVPSSADMVTCTS